MYLNVGAIFQLTIFIVVNLHAGDEISRTDVSGHSIGRGVNVEPKVAAVKEFHYHLC